MSGAIGRHVILPRLPRFMARHPELRLECYVLSEVKDMHAGGLDLLLRASTPPDGDLVARRLLDIRFGVFASPAYLRAAGVPETPEDLRRHRCLVHKPPIGQRPLDDWTFERDGVQTAVRVPRSLVTDDREGLIDAVLAGGGLMRIGMFDPTLLASGRLSRVLVDWHCVGQVPVFALYRRSARASPKILAFLRFVEDAFLEMDPQGHTLVHPAPRTDREARRRLPV